ncbi:uncharacterized protein MONBRDRAFT_34526 [Monosiga brevicollis MX1]|uniref:Protein kinase domain-containing protein n=1 Tax=Monosiga brevicollis TaxID=81824 RepID=A9VCA3_MONBE|nr:uncharacterized protein MONBRDRAFT_34526 [Monosiga brevicollis MX1]EDQ84864.1 predicted protein [Monosiga brevicollis MX1]|eukprot:XP_001750365.1 hypothetical protein [Monosiga brevicollis MX1]
MMHSPRGWLALVVIVLGCVCARAQLITQGCPMHLLEARETQHFSCFNCTNDLIALRYVPHYTVCTLKPAYEVDPICKRRVFWTRFVCMSNNMFELDSSGNISDVYARAGCQVSFNASDASVSLICDGQTVAGEDKLSMMPYGGAPSNLKNLIIRHHRLADIALPATHAFQLLQKLDLSHNRINFIGSPALVWLFELKYLDLSYNDLTSLRPAQLPFSRRLQYMDLRGNPLTTLRTDILISSMAANCTAIYLPSACGSPSPGRCDQLLTPSGSTTTLDPATTTAVDLVTTAAPTTPDAPVCQLEDAAVAMTCPDASAQISSWQYCDGQQDCADGWDEHDCSQRWLTARSSLLEPCSDGVLSMTWHRGHALARPPNANAMTVCIPLLYTRWLAFAADTPEWNASASVHWVQELFDEPDGLFFVVSIDRSRIRIDGSVQGSVIVDTLNFVPAPTNVPTTTSRPAASSTTAPVIAEARASRSALPVIAAAIAAAVVLVGIIIWVAVRTRRNRDTQVPEDYETEALQLFISSYPRAARDVPHLSAEWSALTARPGLWTANGTTRVLEHQPFAQHYMLAATSPTMHVALALPRTTATVEEEHAVLSALVEARILLTMKDHPNVLHLVNVIHERQNIMLVYEPARLGVLSQALSSTSVSREQQQAICGQVASACSYLESLGIVHRNLGAHSVYACQSIDDVRLAGFVMAKDVYLTQEYVATVSKGRAKLTPDRYFWSPEVWRDSVFSFKSDVYAFGRFCWQVCHGGQIPYADMSPTNFVQQSVNGSLPDLPPTENEFLEDLIKSCTQLAVKARPTFATLAAALWEDDIDVLEPALMQRNVPEIAVSRLNQMDGLEKVYDVDGQLMESIAYGPTDAVLRELSFRVKLDSEGLPAVLGTVTFGQNTMLLAEYLAVPMASQLNAELDGEMAFRWLRTVLGTLEYLSSRNIHFMTVQLEDCRLTSTNQAKICNCPFRPSSDGGGEASVAKAAGGLILDMCQFVPTIDSPELRQLGEVMKRGRLKKCSDVMLAIHAADPHRQLEVDADRLTFVRQLGEGEFGVVSLMTLLTTEGSRHVAVKTLHNMTFMEDFKSEVAMMIKLRHPNLVGLLHTTSFGAREPAMILEYMPGGSLETWLQERGRGTGPEDLLYIAHQVTNGMAELARLGIVHRDLAARNVLVGRCLNVKVADYGLSRTMTIGIASSESYYRIKTSRPLPIRWMAPSSILDQKVSTQTDVWSFGCLCYEIWSCGQTCLTVNGELRPSFATLSRRTHPQEWQALLTRTDTPKHPLLASVSHLFSGLELEDNETCL